MPTRPSGQLENLQQLYQLAPHTWQALQTLLGPSLKLLQLPCPAHSLGKGTFHPKNIHKHQLPDQNCSRMLPAAVGSSSSSCHSHQVRLPPLCARCPHWACDSVKSCHWHCGYAQHVPQVGHLAPVISTQRQPLIVRHSRQLQGWQGVMGVQHRQSQRFRQGDRQEPKPKQSIGAAACPQQLALASRMLAV